MRLSQFTLRCALLVCPAVVVTTFSMTASLHPPLPGPVRPAGKFLQVKHSHNHSSFIVLDMSRSCFVNSLENLLVKYLVHAKGPVTGSETGAGGGQTNR